MADPSCGRCQLSGWSTQISPWFRCALTAIHQSYRMCPSHSLEDFRIKIFADQHAVSRCTVIKQQIFQLTGRMCDLHVPVGAVNCTGVVGGNAQIVVADGFHLCGDFFFIPDIILVGNGDISPSALDKAS